MWKFTFDPEAFLGYVLLGCLSVLGGFGTAWVCAWLVTNWPHG